jgi:hypothetical protein
MFALLQHLIAILPGLGATQPYLLTTRFQAPGLARIPAGPDRLGPISRAASLAAASAVPPLLAAYLLFLRGDVTGE